MHLLRCLAFFEAHYGFQIIASHIAGVNNLSNDEPVSALANYPRPGLQRETRLDISELESMVQIIIEGGLYEENIYKA